MLATTWGLTAEDWTAIGTVATALIAFTAACVAFWQLRDARTTRWEQARPYVVAFAEPSAAGEWILDVVIRNFGLTAATDVRIDFDPPLRRAAGTPEPVKLPEVIPLLVPGQEWRTLWDTGIARADSDLPDSSHATVTFKDAHGRKLESKSILDWAPHKQRDVVTTYGLHQMAQALRDVRTEIKRWGEGTRGLRVYARDGDAKDQRIREEHERRRAEQEEADGNDAVAGPSAD